MKQPKEKPPRKERKKKTLVQRSDKELQELINQMEFNRMKLPKSPHPRIMDLWEQYTKRIVFVRDLLNSRKSMVKKDDGEGKTVIPKVEKQ